MTLASDRADQLLLLGRATEALEVLRADGETATSAEALVVASRIFHKLGRYDEALDRANAALRLDPERVGAWLMQALSLLFADRPVEALAPARQAVALAPSVAICHQVVARVLSELGRFDEALHHVHHARSLDPDDPRGWVTLARVQMAQQRWDDAVMSARAALALAPENQEAKVLLGVAQFSGRGPRGRVEAMDTLVSALRDNPDQDHVRQLLIGVAWAGGPSLQTVAIWALISAATSGVAMVVMVVIWSAGAAGRWQTVPPDVRRLIWADRSARRRIVFVLTALALFWVAVVVVFVAIAVPAITARAA